MEKRVSAAFILREDGAALMQHRDDKPGLIHAGKWTVPGGHCDEGESYEDCARREVFEETDYRIREISHLSTFIFDDGDGLNYELALYWTSLDASQTYTCHEGQELKLIRRENAAGYPILDFLLPYWDQAIAEMRAGRSAR